MSITTELRCIAADLEFELYDFGSDVPEAANGWEYDSDGNEWTRVVFFNPVDPDEEESATVAGHFSVTFSHESDEVVGAYASINGNDIGCRYQLSIEIIRGLAAGAKPVSSEDWGSERQIAAEREFFRITLPLLDHEVRAQFEEWALKATTEEMIDEACRLACHKSPAPEI